MRRATYLEKELSLFIYALQHLLSGHSPLTILLEFRRHAQLETTPRSYFRLLMIAGHLYIVVGGDPDRLGRGQQPPRPS